MNEKVKKIKFMRSGESNYYICSLLNNVIKTDVKTGSIYTINNEYIVFSVENKTLHFSYKYIWIYLRFVYKLEAYEVKIILKEAMEIFFPEYKEYTFFKSNSYSDKDKFISKNKLNKLYLDNNNFKTFKLRYVIDDCTIKGKYGRIYTYKKNTLVYYNGCDWFKIDNETKINEMLHLSNEPIHDNIISLDIKEKEHIKIINWFKPHLLINKYNTNYFFQ